MALFSGLNPANLFRNTQQVTVTNPGQQAPNPGAPQAPGGQQAAPNNGPGSTMKQPAATPGSSMDGFTDMWKTDPNASPNQASADPFADPLFQTDPAKIREAAGKMDFVSQLPQELVQKAMSGQDPQSFMQVINLVAQNSLATALQVGASTTEQAGTKLGERFNKAMPGKFRDMQIDSATPSRPELNHPAIQPMLKMTRQQVKMMNPDFSPEQVNKAAEDYLSAFASTMSPQSGGNAANSGNGSGESDHNWLAWVQNQSSSNS